MSTPTTINPAAASERPTRWGRSPAFAREHATAAALQARHPGTIVFYGETSGRYYAMDADGLYQAPSPDALAKHLWWKTHRPQPRYPATSR